MVEAAKCAVEVVELLCDQLDHILQREIPPSQSILWKIIEEALGERLARLGKV